MGKPDEYAFPHWNQFDTDDGVQGFDYPGLTKREYFAAMAMSSMIQGSSTEAWKSAVAKEAAQYADALIAALDSQGDKN